MSVGYPTPANTTQTVLAVKKSRFIAHAMPVASRDDAMAELAQLRQQYPDARHYCWAYVLGDPAGSCDAAMNDDGEPAGTAGKPLLNVLRHKGIGDVMVVVVRYFGGIKLGAGGLTRAYSAAAETAMSALTLRRQETMLEAVMSFDFSREQPVRHWAASRDIVVGQAEYTEQVRLRMRVPQRLSGELREFCHLNTIGLSLS